MYFYTSVVLVACSRAPSPSPLSLLRVFSCRRWKCQELAHVYRWVTKSLKATKTLRARSHPKKANFSKILFLQTSATVCICAYVPFQTVHWTPLFWRVVLCVCVCGSFVIVTRQLTLNKKTKKKVNLSEIYFYIHNTTKKFEGEGKKIEKALFFTSGGWEFCAYACLCVWISKLNLVPTKRLRRLTLLT